MKKSEASYTIIEISEEAAERIASGEVYVVRMKDGKVFAIGWNFTKEKIEKLNGDLDALFSGIAG